MNLDIRGIAFSYRSQEVLRDLSFEVRPNEFIAILGPNGVGKTTLLRCLNALLRPTNGAIIVEGRDLLTMSRMEIAREMAYVAQRTEPVRLTAFDAVLLGRRPHMGLSTTPHDLGVTEAIIARLDLSGLALRYIDELSGGELQKVAIARALVQEPQVLLLDEPTSSLDLKNQLELLELVRAVVQEHGISALMTMHDLNLALRFADRFIMMKDGCIHAAGGPEVVTADLVREVYGVKVAVETLRGYRIVLPEA